MKVDAVYTWVDGAWPGYGELCQRYSNQKRDLNPERYRDGYQLLRYSLRSLEAYLPWINKVYLLTCRPQVPAWLNLEHPKLKLIHHDDVFENVEQLPSFSCNAIESHLHRLPALSKHFIYINDDFLFGRPCEVSDFFPEGKIKLMGTFFGEKRPRYICDTPSFLTSFLEHTPMPMDRDLFSEMLEHHPKQVRDTRAQRFRCDDDLRMDRLFRYWVLRHHPDKIEVEPFYRLLKYYRFHKLENKLGAQTRKLKKLQMMKPKFYCFNDDQGIREDPAVAALVKQYLEETYPEMSLFEKKEL